MSHLVYACGCNMISRFHQLQFAEAITHTEQLSSLPSAERTRRGGGGRSGALDYISAGCIVLASLTGSGSHFTVEFDQVHRNNPVV